MKNAKSVSQVVSIPRTGDKPKKSNGHADGTVLNLGINSRNFQTRFEARYKKIPAMPKGLEIPTFSETSTARKFLEVRSSLSFLPRLYKVLFDIWVA